MLQIKCMHLATRHVQEEPGCFITRGFKSWGYKRRWICKSFFNIDITLKNIYFLKFLFPSKFNSFFTKLDRLMLIHHPCTLQHFFTLQWPFDVVLTDKSHKATNFLSFLLFIKWIMYLYIFPITILSCSRLQWNQMHFLKWCRGRILFIHTLWFAYDAFVYYFIHIKLL